MPRLIRISNSYRPANGLPAAPVESITFLVYSEQSGGTPLWQETQNVNVDAEGHYTALLGATQNDGVPLDLFSSAQPRWLGILFNRPGETEQPRLRLASVPYALKASDAETVGGLPPSAFLLAPGFSAGSGTTGSGASATADLSANLKPRQDSGTTNCIGVFTDPADVGCSVMWQSSSNIGVGTTTPASQLEIVSQTSVATRGLTVTQYTSDASAVVEIYRKARGTQPAPTIVSNGDYIGASQYEAYDGSQFLAGLAGFGSKVNGTPSTGFIPTDLFFFTSGGAVDNNPYKNGHVRMVVSSTGNVGIGTTSPAATLEVNGSTQVDGNLSVAGTVNFANFQSTSSAQNGAAVSGTNTATSGYPVGVQGSVNGAFGAGVAGNASEAGASGVSGYNSATSGWAPGVAGTSASANGMGVNGFNSYVGRAGDGSYPVGVHGSVNGPTGAGVAGNASMAGATGVGGGNSATSGFAPGVVGTSASANGPGVNGFNSYVGRAGDGSYPVGVQGNVNGPTGAGVSGGASMAGAAGVSGNNSATSGWAPGVTGTSASANGMGVNGFNSYVGRAGDGSSPVGVQGGVNGPTGAGVAGSASMAGATGVSGYNSATSGYAVGVQGNANSPNGGAGVQGGTTSTTAVGVRGNNNATTGYAVGVGGFTQSNQGAGVQGNAGNGAYGVVGNAFGTMGWEVGTQGVSSSPEGVGVQGETFTCTTNPCSFIAGTAGQFQAANTGLLLQGMSGAPGAALNTATEVFHVDGTGAGYFGNGVTGVSNTVIPSGSSGAAGIATATSGLAVGTAGLSASPGGAGIAGLSAACSNNSCTLVNGTAGAFYASNNNGGYLLQGFSAPQGSVVPGGTQVFSVDGNGNMTLAGKLTASVKDFKIDDPLDPEHKSLYHASIESSEMVNVYSGNVLLDRNGEAVVTMPEWFEALNTDFRYQLTAIGGRANVYVAREIQDHQFKIAGGRPGMKVSWQVTGVRHDSWAKAHPMQVEEAKDTVETTARR